jgi:hypothetical protein
MAAILGDGTITFGDGTSQNTYYTPVHQGGGSYQALNPIYIGLDTIPNNPANTNIRMQIDSLDFGYWWPIVGTRSMFEGTIGNVGALLSDVTVVPGYGNPGELVSGSYFAQPGTWKIINKDYAANVYFYYLIRIA